MNIERYKNEIQNLICMGYSLKPINVSLYKTKKALLILNRKNNIFSKIPIDILKYIIFPFLDEKFNLQKDYRLFCVNITKQNITWSLVMKYNINRLPLIRVFASNNKKVHLAIIIKKIEKAYYTIYNKWLENITLPLIVLQARLVMNKWLKLQN